MKAYKLIESYSAQPTIEEQFESSLIIKVIYNSSKFRSVQPVLTAGPHGKNTISVINNNSKFV